MRKFPKGDKPLHKYLSCKGDYCPWHNPSPHSMRDWFISIRFDKYGLVERFCTHGVGHPDPDSSNFIIDLVPTAKEWIKVHGCDGCCG